MLFSRIKMLFNFYIVNKKQYNNIWKKKCFVLLLLLLYYYMNLLLSLIRLSSDKRFWFCFCLIASFVSCYHLYGCSNSFFRPILGFLMLKEKHGQHYLFVFAIRIFNNVRKRQTYFRLICLKYKRSCKYLK